MVPVKTGMPSGQFNWRPLIIIYIYIYIYHFLWNPSNLKSIPRCSIWNICLPFYDVTQRNSWRSMSVISRDTAYFWKTGQQDMLLTPVWRHAFTRWWFQIFFSCTPIWRDDPIWLIFFPIGWNNQLDLQLAPSFSSDWDTPQKSTARVAPWRRAVALTMVFSAAGWPFLGICWWKGKLYSPIPEAGRRKEKHVHPGTLKRTIWRCISY